MKIIIAAIGSVFGSNAKKKQEEQKWRAGGQRTPPTRRSPYLCPVYEQPRPAYQRPEPVRQRPPVKPSEGFCPESPQAGLDFIPNQNMQLAKSCTGRADRPRIDLNRDAVAAGIIMAEVLAPCRAKRPPGRR